MTCICHRTNGVGASGPAHCHFSLLILRAKSVTLVYSRITSFLILSAKGTPSIARSIARCATLNLWTTPSVSTSRHHTSSPLGRNARRLSVSSIVESPTLGKRSVGRPPTRWTDRRVADRHWMRKTEVRGMCHALGEVYVQHWTVVGWWWWLHSRDIIFDHHTGQTTGKSGIKQYGLPNKKTGLRILLPL